MHVIAQIFLCGWKISHHTSQLYFKLTWLLFLNIIYNFISDFYKSYNGGEVFFFFFKKRGGESESLISQLEILESFYQLSYEAFDHRVIIMAC